MTTKENEPKLSRRARARQLSPEQLAAKRLQDQLAAKSTANRAVRAHALPPEQEAAAVAAYLEPGATFRSVGKAFNVSHGTIFRLVSKVRGSELSKPAKRGQ